MAFSSARGLEVLLDPPVDVSIVRNHVCVGVPLAGLQLAAGPEALIDLPLVPSWVLLRELHAESGYASTISKALKGAAVVAVGVLLFKGYCWYRRQRAEPSTMQYHLNAEADIDIDLSGDVSEGGDEPVPETPSAAVEVVDGHFTITFGQIESAPIPAALAAPCVPRPSPQKRRRVSHPFVSEVVLACKNAFYGLPSSTPSNLLAISKKVEEMCREKKLTHTDTRKVMALAVPAILSPDKWDVSSARAYNTEARCIHRAELVRASHINGWLSNLLCHPLSAKSWRRAFDRLAGLPDWKAHQFVK